MMFRNKRIIFMSGKLFGESDGIKADCEDSKRRGYP